MKAATGKNMLLDDWNQEHHNHMTNKMQSMSIDGEMKSMLMVGGSRKMNGQDQVQDGGRQRATKHCVNQKNH